MELNIENIAQQDVFVMLFLLLLLLFVAALYEPKKKEVKKGSIDPLTDSQKGEVQLLKEIIIRAETNKL